MSDLREDIKALTDEEKEEIFSSILSNYFHMGICGMQFRKNEIISKIQEKYGRMISPDEITAAANIAGELMAYANLQNLYFNRIPRRKEFIDSICKNQGIRRENVLGLVKATVSDIVGYRKYTSGNREYEFNVNHVMDITQGKDPYRIHKKEFEAQEARNKFKIVK